MIDITLLIPSTGSVGYFSVGLGIALISFAMVVLLYIIPRSAYRETNIAAWAMTGTMRLIIGGFVILILGLVFLMGLFPMTVNYILTE